MKRIVTRGAALSVVVVAGLGAITQAQRMLRNRADETGSAQAAIDTAQASSSLLEEIGAGATPPKGNAQDFAAASDRYPALLDAPSDPPYVERSPAEDELVGPTTRGQSPLDDEPPLGGSDPSGRVLADELAIEEPGRLPEFDDEPKPLAATRGSARASAHKRLAYDNAPEATPLGEDDSAGELVPVPDAALDDAGDAELPADSQEDPYAAEPTPAPAGSSRRRYDSPAESAEPEAAEAPTARSVPPSRLPPAGTRATAPIRRQPTDVAPLQSEAAEPPLESPPVVEGSGRPGHAELEGPQSHALELEKHFPADAQVGQAAAIEIKLRNAGTAVARELEIQDAVPQGTRLVATRPQAELDANGAVRWAIASLKPGEEANVTMEVMPLVEGELGSVATVRYAAEASARAVVTRPVVELSVAGPKQVLVGDDATFAVKVANTGTGVARDLLLSDQIPEGLSHPSGVELEYEVGDLRPGETREVQLPLKAAKAGQFVNVIAARGEGEAHAENRSQVEVIAPQVTIDLQGGPRRYLERPAKFTLAIGNQGTASAKRVEIAAELPPGLEFVDASHFGQYDEQAHVIRWSLEELPANQTGNVELTVKPMAEGEQKIALRATADPQVDLEKSQSITVEGIATMMFEVVDVEDPIEQGNETSYEIRVVNQGTKGATNVQVVAILPDGLEAIDADGPSRYQIDGKRVLFDPVARLAPKADTSYRVRVKALKAGEQRMQVQMMSDDMETPVTEEESTRVYSNE